jgi:hypothetical protein
MSPMKLYKILQQYVGAMNLLTVKVFNEEIDSVTALQKAREETQKFLAVLEE